MAIATRAKIQNITSKGQITLPVAWRRKTGAGQIVVRVKGTVLEIAPVEVSSRRGSKDYTVFDASRDNKGKGIRASDVLTLLQEVDALEDALLASDHGFIRKMRRFRREHARGHVGDWQALKKRHGV